MGKRGVKLALMVSSEERKQFFEFAQGLGMDLSSLIRYLIIKEIRAEKLYKVGRKTD